MSNDELSILKRCLTAEQERCKRLYDSEMDAVLENIALKANMEMAKQRITDILQDKLDISKDSHDYNINNELAAVIGILEINIDNKGDMGK